MQQRLSLATTVATAVAIAAAPRAVAQTAPPERIYVNGNIYTLDASRPRAEGLALHGARIVAVGSNAQMRALAEPTTRVVDLSGRTVLPGLIDAHGHMSALGFFGLGRLDLGAARSFDEVLEIVRRRIEQASPGEWILGGRWDHESWPDRKLPTHEKLSAISPENPVWLVRVDGHAGLANAVAMRLAGVGRDTPSPSGGEILRHPDGTPTGLFVDNAETLITRHVEGASADAEATLLKAQEMCLSTGLTGVHDAGVSPADIEVYRRLAESGRLKLRVYAMVQASAAIEYFTANEPLIGDRLTVRACKLYIDGALGSRGAWLLEPYADRPTDEQGRPYAGLAVAQSEFIRSICEHALQRGYQVCTHAIGDRGNRVVLEQYGLALTRAAGGAAARDHRFRIEHAQLLAAEDIPRFAKLGVVGSMQPTHCTSDMRWAEKRVGSQRAEGAYAWASLLRSGAVLAFGSDFPVESHNPFLGLYAAITRQDGQGQPPGGWFPAQRLTREEALRAFTLGAAYAAFEERDKGSLTPGKLADFVVIDRDVMVCEPREIPLTRVIETVIGGETVYRAP